MKRIWIALITVLTACSPAHISIGSLDIVPQPRETVTSEGCFLLDKSTVISCADSLKEPAMLLSCLLQDCGTYVPVKDGRHAIALRIDPSLGDSLKPFRKQECYRLDITRDGVTVAIPCGSIFDFPEFAYRAFMLDCCRHFFPLSTIKKVIDILALHQINQFHWHLSEDQGWRLEIKRYPLLTETGSYRECSPIRDTAGHDDIPVSGFYTQDDAREIVRYAAMKGISVIPEIDIPGHTKAALASYPELGCTGGPYTVACEYGVLDDVLCAGKENTMDFVCNVLDEVMDIFPSKYIHLGGDECPKIRWESCPRCQEKINSLGLRASGAKTREELLQSWFMDQVAKHVESRGRRVIAWNDVLVGWDNVVSGAPSAKTVIAGWMRPVSSEIAVREGYDAIVCPVGHLYLSARDGNLLKGEPYIRRVYDLETSPQALSPLEQSRILGVEACIWTEWVDNEDLLLWELLPRLGAVSELQWSAPESRDYSSFICRLSRMQDIYTARSWNWNRWDRCHDAQKTEDFS